MGKSSFNKGNVLKSFSKGISDFCGIIVQEFVLGSQSVKIGLCGQRKVRVFFLSRITGNPGSLFATIEFLHGEIEDTYGAKFKSGNFPI